MIEVHKIVRNKYESTVSPVLLQKCRRRPGRPKPDFRLLHLQQLPMSGRVGPHFRLVGLGFSGPGPVRFYARPKVINVVTTL